MRFVRNPGRAEGVSKSVDFVAVVKDINSLAHLERIDKVGETTDACGRLLTDTAFNITTFGG